MIAREVVVWTAVRTCHYVATIFTCENAKMLFLAVLVLANDLAIKRLLDLDTFWTAAFFASEVATQVSNAGDLDIVRLLPLLCYFLELLLKAVSPNVSGAHSLAGVSPILPCTRRAFAEILFCAQAYR
jgi:hypothetical protein